MDTTDILISIRKIVRAINLESKRVQKEYGVSIPQILCLSFLRESNNFQNTQYNIREFLNLNPSTVTGIINRLEKRGLIARLPKTGDKRVTNISLTSSGDQLIKKIPPLLHEQLAEKLDNLNMNQKEVLYSGLNKLVELLDISGVEASPVLTMEDDLE
ncbi:MAG: MarR family winged helix-turn-helix transcriptional regulator [Bacteroidota bacterium]